MAVTDPRPGEALATGDAVNAAARLEQAAEPGQVLLSECAAQAARHYPLRLTAGARGARESRTAARSSVVEEGRPHLVTLYGEAGVGRSRLVGELLAGLETAAPTPRMARGRDRDAAAALARARLGTLSPTR